MATAANLGHLRCALFRPTLTEECWVKDSHEKGIHFQKNRGSILGKRSAKLLLKLFVPLLFRKSLMSRRRAKSSNGTKLQLETFENRIVPAGVVKFTQVDGGTVAVRTNKGTTEQLEAALAVSNGDTGVAGFTINLVRTPALAAVFAGTNVTVTARGGTIGIPNYADNVTINAADGAGGSNIDLGTVSVNGNLVELDAGDANMTTLAVKNITVTDWRDGGPFVVDAQKSEICGNLGAVVVRRNFQGWIQSNDINGIPNFSDTDGTLIRSFRCSIFGGPGANDLGHLEVRGIGNLNITDVFVGGAAGSRSGYIRAIGIDRIRIHAMAGGDLDTGF